MPKNYKKLKIAFQDDPETLRSLEAEEQMEMMKSMAGGGQNAFLESLKSIFKGDEGYTPEKGKDYFTKEETDQWKKEILAGATPEKFKDYFTPDDMVKLQDIIRQNIKDEVTPKKGEDYFDGEDGMDADEDEIVDKVLKRIPSQEKIDENQLMHRLLALVPKEVFPTVDEIVKEIKSKQLLELRDIKGARLDRPMNMNDQRWHGGGISNITGLIQAGTNITITGIGTQSSPYVINSAGGGSAPGGVQYDVQLNDGAGGFAGSNDLNFQGGYLTINGDSGYGQLQFLNSPASSGYGGAGINGTATPIIVGALNGDLSIWSTQAMNFSTDSGATKMLQLNTDGTFTIGAYTLPATDGTANYVLKTNGLGVVSWSADSSTPGGLNTQLQYNNAGVFGGITGAVTNGTSVSLTGAHLLNPTINGAGVGLATLTYPNTATSVSIALPATSGTVALTSDLTGFVTSVSGTANRITSTGGTTPVIDISTSYVGQSSITTLGTISTGVWHGTAIGSQYGGTGIDSSASTGVAQVSSGVWSISTALANGTTATTQASSDSSTKIATTAYVTDAIATAVTGLLDYRGSYNASTNLFPATGGSGIAGVILKGDFWICSVAGTLGGVAVTPGDLIIAIVDTPGQTASNWDLIPHDLGSYVTSVSGTTNRITSTGGATPVIDISASYVGQSSITTLGTITTGVWSGTTIAVTKGGTGLTSISALSILVANSANTFVELTPSAGQSIRINAGGTAWEAYTPGGSGITIGTTTITSGTNTRILYNNSGVVGEYTLTGTGTAVVMANTPTLITPVLGAATYTTLSGGAITNSSLTAGRVTFAGTAGLMTDDTDFTFATDTLTVTKIAATQFTGNITLSTVNIVTDTSTGTKIGTATNQKLGFFNATPVVQQTGDIITALSNLGLVSGGTISGGGTFLDSTATSVTVTGTTSETDLISYTLAGGILSTNKGVRIRCYMTISWSSNGAFITYNVKYGGTTIASFTYDPLGTPTQTAQIVIEGYIIGAGTTSTQVCNFTAIQQGMTDVNTALPVIANSLQFGKGASSINSTTSQIISITTTAQNTSVTTTMFNYLIEKIV